MFILISIPTNHNTTTITNNNNNNTQQNVGIQEKVHHVKSLESISYTLKTHLIVNLEVCKIQSYNIYLLYNLDMIYYHKLYFFIISQIEIFQDTQFFFHFSIFL